MAPPSGPPGFAAVVAARQRKTTGYLLASVEPCLSIRDREIREVHRNLLAVDATDLATFSPTGSWLLGVLVCLEDASGVVAAVASWARGLEPSPRRARVRLYLHEDVDVAGALAGWHAAGLEDPLTGTVRDFKSFHKQFGWDFNNQVYRDATGAG